MTADQAHAVLWLGMGVRVPVFAVDMSPFEKQRNDQFGLYSIYCLVLIIIIVPGCNFDD